MTRLAGIPMQALLALVMFQLVIMLFKLLSEFDNRASQFFAFDWLANPACG